MNVIDMQTNKASLPVMSVQGKVDHPIMSGNGYRVGYDGYGRIPMATGGIIYNYKIGDSCMGIAGDHIEPGVSLMTFALFPIQAKACSALFSFSTGFFRLTPGSM